MRQCDIIRLLFNDLKESTSQLILGDYHDLFEQELQDHYPFNKEIEAWLVSLYQSEKYNTLEGDDRSLFFEKAHPFLFLRDLATLNNWRQGFGDDKRRDQVVGLFFSMTPDIALEASLAICRPSRLGLPVGSWFDAKQVMKNLEFQPDARPDVEAWRGSAFHFLYMFFTSPEQPPKQEELFVMLEPFQKALDFGFYHGGPQLKSECALALKALECQPYETMMDRL